MTARQHLCFRVCLLLDVAAVFFRQLFLKLISQTLQEKGAGEAGLGGLIWLGEVTMRYGGEEDRPSDTASRWCFSVMYNGNMGQQNSRPLLTTWWCKPWLWSPVIWGNMGTWCFPL